MISRQPFERRPFLASVTKQIAVHPRKLPWVGRANVTRLLLSLIAISRENQKANLTAFAATAKRQEAKH
jgi:hypothetical protein